MKGGCSDTREDPWFVTEWTNPSPTHSMSTIQLHFFGPGLTLDQTGQAIPMRSRKQLALLVYLATEHQIAHSRESLQALFWPAESTAVAQNNLRVTLSRLREWAGKVAGTASPASEVLIIERSTVQFHPDWVARVDVNLFTQHLESTRQHRHSTRQQCGHCQAALRAAVQLYRGEFLAGFALDDCPALEEWLFMQRERLHMLVLEAYSDLASYAESNGELTVARDFAQRQIEFDPLREPAYRQQMRILVKQGERGLALATFERCRTLLRAELGLDPDPETLSLHQQLLEGEGTAQTQPGSPSAPASDAVVAPRHNLPQQLTSFIGREAELAQLRQRLQEGAARLITLVGPGGMGKTRLALQVAAENLHLFAQGVCFVPLASVQRAESIPAAIMEALGLRFVPGAIPPTQQLLAALGKRQMLLIIDNLEHLLEGVDLLLELLQAAPGVTLLVTTREQLNCQAEDLFVLHGLATPTSQQVNQASHYTAVRLFCDRAYRLDKSFKLTAENNRDIVQICRWVDGLPLAIELVATWLRDYDCADLAATLVQDQSLLATTQRDVPARHRSMQVVFHHSWQLLSPGEQRILSQLAVCPGAFSVQSAVALTGASLVDLTRLRYKSLLRSTAAGLYEFHPLIRHFAEAMLTATDRQEAAARQATVYAQLVAGQTTALHGATPQSALQAIGRELDNIEQAWQWAQAQGRSDLLLQSVVGLGGYYAATGRSAEGETRFLTTYTALVAHPVQAEQHLLGLHLLNESCPYLIWQNKLPSAIHWAQTLVAAAQAAAHREFVARGLGHWGNALHFQGEMPAAIQKAEEALALARQEGQPRLIGQMLCTLGIIHLQAGERGAAERNLLEGLPLQRSQGDVMTEQRTLVGLGRIHLETGDYEAGQGYLTAALHLLQMTGNRVAEARIVNALGFAEAMLGNYGAALEHHAASRQISQEIQQPIQESHALHNLCTVQRKLGNLTLAEAYGQEALRLALLHDLNDAACYARLHLGYVWLEGGELDLAANAFQAAHNDWLTHQHTDLAHEATAGLAAVAYRAGKLAEALTLITPLVSLLINQAIEGIDEPFTMYLTAYYILHDHQDAQAGTLLTTAYTRLNDLASKISDPALRHSFWQAPAHRQIRALWQESTNR